jgi:hypothetical protein
MPNIPADLHYISPEQMERWAYLMRERGWHVVKRSRVRVLTGQALLHDDLVEAGDHQYLEYIRENLAVRVGLEAAKAGAMVFETGKWSEWPWRTRKITATVGIIMPRTETKEKE